MDTVVSTLHAAASSAMTSARRSSRRRLLLPERFVLGCVVI